MHIAVILRIVPDLSDELDIDDHGTDIDREWVGLKLNEFDDHALEEAVLIKEASGARVTAVAFAGDGAERQLQNAVARGVDDVLMIEHNLKMAITSRMAAHLLAQSLPELGAQVVLTGVQTSEDVYGQLAPFLAGAMNWPTLNAVHGVSVAGKTLTVTQEYSGGHAAQFATTGPVVLGVQTASRTLRYVPGSKLREAAGTSIAVSVAELPTDMVRTTTDALEEPQRNSSAEMIAGDANTVAKRIVAVLSERGLLGVKV
jgi:electron transfer flavoprotein beta subunit